MSNDESTSFQFTPRKVLVAFAVAIIVLSFVAYGGSLDNRFTNWDDNWLITENQIIQDPSAENLWHIVNPAAPREELGNEYLPTRDLSYVLNHAMGDMDPTGYHFLDLLMHIFVSLLVMLLAWRLTRQHWMAGLAGLLFAVHPVHVEAVAWASSRKDMLSTVFLMLSVHLYISARRERSDSSKLKGRKLALGLALGCFALALTSKMTAVVLPALLLGVELFFGQQLAKSDLKTRALKQAPFWGMSAAFTLLAMSIGSGLMREPYGEGQFQSLLTATSALTRDFQILITGRPTVAAVDMPVQTGFGGSVTLGLLIIAVLGGVAAWGLNHARSEKPNPLALLLAFCSVWFVVSLSPVSNVLVQIGTVFAERYLYIPSIGFSIGFAGLLTWLVQKNRKILIPTVISFVGAVVVVWAIFTSYAAANWADSETLWQHTIDVDSGNHIAYFNLGREYHERSQLESDETKRDKLLARAFTNYEHALANPARTYRNDPSRVYGQMSLVEVTRGNAEQALTLITKAFEHVEQPWRNERATNDIVSLLETPHGMALSALGRHDDAVQAFRRSIEASDAIGRPSGSRINLAQELARYALKAKPINEGELKEAYQQLDEYDKSRGEQVLISLHARARITMKEFDSRLAASGKGGELEIPDDLRPTIKQARELYREIIKHHIPKRMRAKAESNLYLEAADAMARGRAGDKTAEKYLLKSLKLSVKREGTRYLLSQLYFEQADVAKKPSDKIRARKLANIYLQEELQLHPEYKPALQLLAVGLRQKAVDEAVRLRHDFDSEYRAVTKTEDTPTWQGLIVKLYRREKFQQRLLTIVALLRDSTEKDPDSKEGHALMEGTGLVIALGMWFTRDNSMRANAEELLRTAFNANSEDSDDRPNPVARVLTQFYLELAEKLVYRPDEKLTPEQRREDMNGLLMNMLSLSESARKVLSGKLRKQAMKISAGPYSVKDPDGKSRELSKGTRDMMASELMRAAIALNPENISALDWLKNYLEDEGNLEEAIKTFEQLVAALDGKPDLMHGVHLSLAQLQLDLGEQQLRAFRHKLKLNDSDAAKKMRDKAVVTYLNAVKSTDFILNSRSGQNLSMAVRIRGVAGQRLAYLDTSRAKKYYDIAIAGYERVPSDFKSELAEVRRKQSWFVVNPAQKLEKLKVLLNDAPPSMDTTSIELEIRALKARIADNEARIYLAEGNTEKALARIETVMNTPSPDLFATRGKIYLKLAEGDPSKYFILAASNLCRAVTDPVSLLKAADLYWKNPNLMYDDKRYVRARTSYERAYEVLELEIPTKDIGSLERTNLEIQRRQASKGMGEMNGISAVRTRSAKTELANGNLSEALRQVSDALEMNGKNLQAWKVQSRVYRAEAKALRAEGDVDASRGKLEEAELCIVSALRLDLPLLGMKLDLQLELVELLFEANDKDGAKHRLDMAKQTYSLASDGIRKHYKERLELLAEALK